MFSYPVINFRCINSEKCIPRYWSNRKVMIPPLFVHSARNNKDNITQSKEIADNQSMIGYDFTMDQIAFRELSRNKSIELLNNLKRVKDEFTYL